MASVRVAVRVRPLSKRETKEGGRIIVEVDGKVAKIRNLKVDGRPDGFGDSREKVVAFGFDYCYWSVNPEDPEYASQDVVFQDLGTEVLSGAAKGYNICLFAYGQTGSGKTYTMLGTPASVGLTPRICEGLFIREEDHAPPPSSCRIKVSFLEIYNERVRDLLKQSNQKKSYPLRVREHPEMGPYVQGLSQHVVTNYKQVIQLLEEGIANRITAATHVHEASSRSHAIFTIHYTQAILENNFPSEIASKINLVDLAGSERADPSYCKDRITEGANINKSLVTLGIVISTLAQNSQVFSSCQSLNSTASDGGDSGIPSCPSGTSSGWRPSRRQSYIPYRDSVLTWLLKDSLGGNSKTIMVATVSPAHTSYSETMSTLRYASNAKNIINKPRVNEDANVKLIRELREEIGRLKAMLLSFELRNFSSLNVEKDENLKELVLQNELKIDQLTKDWTRKWNEWQALVEHYRVDINRRRAGVVIDSSLPHLMVLEDDVLSTGVVLYHLKEGTTKIGRIDSDQEQDIVLQGQWIERDHCTITSACGVVILRPAQGARCTVNGREVTASCRLTQGAVITLGKAQKFRFNHPAEAAVLRQRRQVGEAVGGSGSLEWLDLDGDVTASRLGLCPLLWKERRVLGEQSDEDHQPPRAGETPHRAQIQQQQCYVGDLRQRILAGQIRAKQELEVNQASASRQIKDNQQWLLREETWLARLQQQQQQDYVAEKELEASLPPDAWLQTGPETQPSPLARSRKRVVRLQLLRRHALRAAERNIRRRRVSLQLERIIKNQRLLEAQKRLEQLKALCWLQNDCPQKPPYQVPSHPTVVPGPQHRSISTSCSSLSLRRLCSQYLPQLRSVFLNWDPSTTLPPIPDPTDQISEKTPSEDYLPQAASYLPRTGHFSKNALCSSGEGQLCTARGALAREEASAPDTCFTMSSESASIQEMERVGKQPHWMVSQSLASLGQSANKLKPGDEPKALTPSTHTRKGKGPADSGHAPAGWRKQGNFGTHKAAKGAGYSSSHPRGPKQAAGCGKPARALWAESKPPSPSRTSKRQQRVLAARVRDVAKKSSCLPHGSPLKRQHSAGDPDTMASLTDSDRVVDHARGKDDDLSDADSSYSVDSLSCVCAKALTEPLKPEDPQGKERDLLEPENSESDDSQISKDSLAEKGYQSPQDSPEGSYLTNGQGHTRARARVSVRGFTTSSDSGLFAQTHRSFSLDSLIDVEEELGEDQQEEPFFGSADEMPTETFWHLQTSSLPIVDEEAMCSLSPINYRTGARLDAILPMSSSFYLDPQPQPHCEQPESEVEARSSEQANTLQGIQLSRGSPLLSVDSWFSCDSKINSSSPPGIVSSSCPSPDVQEFQPCGWERPGYWLNMEELKPSGTETVLPYSPKLPQGGAEVPDSVRAVYTIPAADTSRLSLWGSYRLLQPGADGTFQARSIPDMAQQGNSEASNNSSVSSMLVASAASFPHVGSACEKDWAALQQKYFLELSHPVLEAVGEPRPSFPSLEEDSRSLTQASIKGGDTLLPVGSGVSSSLDFNNFPIHLSKIRRLRAEKEQDSMSVELEGTSDFFTTSEKEVSCSGTYSADVESLTSGTTNAQVFAAENRIANSMVEACEVKQNNLEESSQSSEKPGLMTSSDECFFPKNPCHSNVTIATKEDHWPQGWAPLRKNSAGQAGQLSHNSHHPLQEEKADYQESSKEVVGRHTNLSFAFPSGPELYLHSAPWNPFPSSLQPPLVETFYVTKSRDALTETALEIPACREARVPSPPPREAWGFGHDHQALQNVYLKNSVPVLLQNQNSKIASSQQVTTERPVDLNTKEVSGETGKCPGNIKEESHNSVYFFVAQNRHFLPSTSTKVCEFENQVGILNKHSLPALKEGEKATGQSYCNVRSNGSGSRKPLQVCESEAGGEEEQHQNAVLRQTQAFDNNRQLTSRARSDFMYRNINLGLDKDMLGEPALSWKSRSVHHRVSSPEIMAQDESPTYKGEWKNETGLLGKAFHPKDSSEEVPRTESTYKRFQSVTCSQEINSSEGKGPGKSQETLNSKEELSGKKQNKRVNNGDEMAKLIRSVTQLENGILEIESKQNKQPYASNILRISKEFVIQDQKDQDIADHVPGPGSSGDHFSFKDQPSSPKQTDDVIFRDGEAGEMELSSSSGEDLQVQKITLSPFQSRECVQDVKFVREHTQPAVLDRPTRDTCDYLGTCTAHRESTNPSVNPRRTKALARALPLQSRPERSSEKEGKLVDALASPKGQPCALGSLEKLETVKGFQESHVAKCISSSKQEEPKIQGRVDKMAVQRGGSLQEEKKMVSLTQKLPSPSQHCMGTFSSQETGPLLSQPRSSMAPHQDLSNTLPLNSPRLQRSYLHAPDTIGVSSVDYVLDPTMLKMPDSPLVTGAGCQDHCGEPRSHSPQGNVRGGSSMAHSAWCGSAISMAMGSRGQSSVPESIPLGAEGRRSVSTSPQDQGGDLRNTSMGLSTRVGSVPEAEAAVQGGTKKASSLNRISSPLEMRASCPLEEGNNQGREVRQEAEELAEDLSPTSGAFSAPLSLPTVPHPEASAHTSTGLAMLEETRQVKTQGKQPHDLVLGGTVLPYYEILLEPECSSRAPGRPQCQQMDPSVSDVTRNEGEAQGFHVASLSVEPGHLLTDERKVLQATPLSADSFQPLPNTETNTRPWYPSQTSSHADPALDKSHCPRELRHFLGTGEQFKCRSSSSEIIEKKKKATKTPSSAGPLGSDSLPSSTAVEEDRRVIPEKVVAALSSQALSDDPRVILHGQSQLAPWETAEGMPPGNQESSPAHQEPRILDTTFGGASGNFLVAAQGVKTTYFESQLMICDVQNSASLSGPNQDHVQHLEASTGLEGRASPKQGTVLPGALRRVELEAPSQQCVKWKGNVGSGLAEACRAGSKHPRPTPLPDQRPSPDPGGVREEALCRCPQETLDCVVFSGSIEGSKTKSASGGQEDSRTLPCQQLCSPQPIASHACFITSSTLLCYRDGDMGKGTSKVAPHTLHPPCIVPSWACRMDEKGESYPREPGMLLAHGLEPKGINVEFGATDSSTLEPSTTAAVLSLAEGCSSPALPDVRTVSLSHSVADGSSKSVGDPEKKVAEKTIQEREAAAFPAGIYSEPLRKLQHSSVGGQNAQESQTKPEPPVATGRPHILNLSEGFVESELVVEPQHRCLENVVRCLPEKPQLSTESRNHSSLHPQAKFIAKLKHVSGPQVDSPWEEEEQEGDQASGGGDEPPQGRSPPRSDEGSLNGCQVRDARGEEVAAAKPPVSKTFSSGFKGSAAVPLGQSGAPWPAAQSPGQPSSGREQPAPRHRCSVPVIAIFSGPKHSKSSPRQQFSVVSSSRSLQELNLSVEPPSPTDEDTQDPNRLWNTHPRDYSSGRSAARTSLQVEGCSQKALSNVENSTADHRPLQPATPPYPTSSAVSCMPTPDFMTSWKSGTLEQARQGKPARRGDQRSPEKQHSEADKGVLHFGSSDINPYVLPWWPEGPACIGWKQYVFGSAVDVSCSQTPQGLIPSNIARCSSMDNGLDDQNALFHSHLSTYANARGLLSTHSSIENARGSHEAWEVWGSSFALGNSRILTDSEGAAPTKGPDKRAQFPGTPDEAGCLRSEAPLAEGSAAGPVDEIMLLYLSEAGSPVEQSRVSTLEQGTQTQGCRLHWSYTDISSAQSEASAMPVPDLATWTSMHNLSLHLSRLLHSTSELLGSLSQPSVTEKKQNTKREIPDEVPEVLMMDSCTQTTVDEGIQTDLASPPLQLQAPEANPQEVSVVLEVLGTDISTMSQEKGHVPGTLQKREAEETAWKTAGPPDLQEESPHCRPQSPPGPLSHLRFQKASFGQNLPFVSLQASPDASLPPSSQPEEPSCLAVSSPSLSISHSPGPCPSAVESVREPGVQKELCPTNALLVDRASSPILTLSASIQALGLPSASLPLWAPSAHPLEGHQKLVSSPDLPLDAPRPPRDNYSQTTEESDGSQRVRAPCGEVRSPLERSDGRSFLEISSPSSPQQSPKLQVHFLEQPPQQLQPRTTTWVQSRLPPPPRSRSQRLADRFVPEGVASLECGPLSSRGLRQGQSKTENGGESSASPVQPQPTLDISSSWGGLQHLSPCRVSKLTGTTGLQGSTLGPTEVCQPEGLLRLSSQMCMAPEPQHPSLRDLPMHNKFSNWCGVQDGSPRGPGVMDLSSGEQAQRPPQPPDNQSQDPEWSQKEQITLQVGAQNLSLSMELTEAKLHHGFGEADALLQVLQNGTGEALTADEPVLSTWEELYARQKQTIETLRRERAERLQNFRRTRSLSPQKQLSLLPNRDLPTRDPDLPSRRREYLQQLRKDVVETTRSQGSASRSAHPPSDIELMLREYQRAREEAKVEIAQARDRLRERAEQEKLRIRQQIISQLLREEEKLHTLATSSSLCTSSNGSLSSGVTSGYNSSPALPSQLQSPDNVGDTNLPDSRVSWIGDVRGHSAVRNSHLNLAGSTWKSLAYSRRASLGSCCCSPSSLSSLGTCFSSSYQDLAKHIVDISMADVMAACSDNLHNLFSHQAAAGWNYQGEEQEVQLYYKVFSSTRHGFLGAGVVAQPVSHVWAAVSDPTLWPLYHKPIQTARLHQRVTNSINLVYLVCNNTLCALKQPRDFCCVCVEAKEGHLSIMAAQSVYDTSMPRPSREMVRGEILPSAWILQPLTMEGKEITRVIYLVQVEFGAPGFPAPLLSSFIKQQPLVIARLASFLGS
ncbi:stAR-related lipid transfer protein 9 isoform X6 [Diceros bicornis minor]|uniref:stAR-related lipid transfer protein 9 isoform X6 n=1 Tax=Diceros bicornis minor TaxID=77932 RepID=UPI0026F35FED|nr:stAR-related lipid transfer protein 9 isoform X6 [Diceros bicornis minor]